MRALIPVVCQVLDVRTAQTAGGTALDALGCHTERVHSSRALTEVIERAMERRVTDANDYHSHSSRSHALLTLKLERRAGRTSQESCAIFGKLIQSVA